MPDPIYLDHNATTATDPRVVAVMQPYFSEIYGNPSSLYGVAQDAREAVEEARDQVAHLLSASPGEIVFTSGGTEANNFAIKGVAYALRDRGNHVITSKIEHHAVLNPCRFLEKVGFRVSYLSVDAHGLVDLDELAHTITDDTILVTIMHANNEVGTIEPIREAAGIAKKRGIYFHTDAVQTVGKIPVDVNDLGVDMLSLSAHKFYGPKGVGALYIRRGTTILPLIHGGHHEKNRRAGTENVPGIVGLGKACEIAANESAEEEKNTRSLRDRLYRGISEKVEDVLLLGHPEKRLAGTLAICVKWIEGESMLLLLDAEGIAASSGSACTSGSLEPSHVLTAMGVPPEIAHGSLRLSLGRHNTLKEIDRVIEVFPPIVERLRMMSPFSG
ncbi:cysteine desulfurase [candidate division TA06 bacterium DG_26]|uniref:Cysteine desulfurase IscS n=1 Tax=candidate division TA06 bacterium DG_26 TaxID=1703771 RepID=A0A0S7WJX0_UNCT6|nr:MAG: cysteine desulfurase [candidate division TA06 bacterium DG_26]